jgi:diguanylate cyclase (GGDEF)-like protein
MSSIQKRTIALATEKNNGDDGSRSLVQLYPLDLNRGPIELTGGRTTMGRGRDCDLPIADDSVSRQHAEIRVTDQGCVILDLESTNGISVNGSPVEAHQLSSGDCIQLGSHVFRFLADDDLESQYHATVYSMMTRDGLTGAYNRRYLEETLDREVARCRRHERPIAVIMIDVDDFKSINDAYGHMIGDQVLREVAQRLQTVSRKDDVLARFGGEEFTVVMVEANVEHAVEIAERCRIAIESEPVQATVGPIPVTISLGVAAPSPEDLGTSVDLINEADERMYEAKRAGRNRTVC